MPILDPSSIKKMLPELRAVMTSDPVNTFINTRKLMTHFVVLLEEKQNDTLVGQLQEALNILEQTYEKADPGQIDHRDIFKAVDVLLELLKQYSTATRVAGCVMDAFCFIIYKMPSTDLKRMHKSLVESFSSKLSRVFEERANGRVMMKCVQMLHQYIWKFPPRIHEEVLRHLIKALATDVDAQLLELPMWKKQTVEQCSRSFANSMPGARFYVFVVSSVRSGGSIFKPPTVSVDRYSENQLSLRPAIYVEFNDFASNYSFEALEENDENTRLIVVRFEDIQKYQIINDKDGPCVDVQLQDAAMRFHAFYAQDLIELRQFLSPIIGDREENAATCLDTVIKRIRLDASSVFNRAHVRNTAAESSIIPEHTRLTLPPSAVASIELNDSIATDSSGALEHVQRDATQEKGKIELVQRGVLEANGCTRATSTRKPKSPSIENAMDQGSPAYPSATNGGTWTRHLTDGAGAGNALVKPVTDDIGRVRPDIDPYDTSHIRDDDILAPSASGKKRGRGSNAAKTAQPSNQKANRRKQQFPSLIKAIVQQRAQQPSANVNEQPAVSGRATRKARNNRVVMQSPSDEDDDLENHDPDSDESWHTDRRKAPPKRKGRRQSVMSVEKITSKKALAADADFVDSDSMEWNEMLEQIKNNRILDSNSSNASLGRKRKSPTIENARDQGTCAHPSVTNDGMWANKRHSRSPGSLMDVAASGSFHGELDLREQDTSHVSSQQPNGMDMSVGQTSSKLQYISEHVVKQIIGGWQDTRERNLANVEHYIDPILNTRQELMDVMDQKEALFMQHVQAAKQAYEDFTQATFEFNRILPSESVLESRIRQAKDADHKLTEKIKNDTASIVKEIEELTANGWNGVQNACMKAAHYAIFNSNL